MRLLFPVLALPLLIPAASTAQTPAPAVPIRDMPVFTPGPDQSAECPPTSRYHAAKRRLGDKKLQPQHLTDLPMADTYAAVYRHIGRCEAPIIVRYGIGGEQR